MPRYIPRFKSRGKTQIPRLGSKFRGVRKTVGPSYRLRQPIVISFPFRVPLSLTLIKLFVVTRYDYCSDALSCSVCRDTLLSASPNRMNSSFPVGDLLLCLYCKPVVWNGLPSALRLSAFLIIYSYCRLQAILV